MSLSPARNAQFAPFAGCPPGARANLGIAVTLAIDSPEKIVLNKTKRSSFLRSGTLVRQGGCSIRDPAVKCGGDTAPVVIDNAEGEGEVVLLCDHASNNIPAQFHDLGLKPDDLARHIAWDPGALEVATAMSARLDAPVVYSTVSRLVIDCNRPLHSDRLIVTESDGTHVPGNRQLDETARSRRIEAFYRPFHAAVDELLDHRAGAGRDTALVAIHSFNPVYGGVARPWHVGVIFGADRRLADPVLAGLRAEANIVVGENQPYSPADQVFWTLETHGEARGFMTVMIELRNDIIATKYAQARWAERLSELLEDALGKRATAPQGRAHQPHAKG